MVTDVLVISAFFLMLLCPCLVGLHASLSEDGSAKDGGAAVDRSATAMPATALAMAPVVVETAPPVIPARLPWSRTAFSGLALFRVPSAAGFVLGCLLGVGGTLVAVHAHASAHPPVRALRLAETALWLTDNVGSGWAR